MKFMKLTEKRNFNEISENLFLNSSRADPHLRNSNSQLNETEMTESNIEKMEKNNWKRKRN